MAAIYLGVDCIKIQTRSYSFSSESAKDGEKGDVKKQPRLVKTRAHLYLRTSARTYATRGRWGELEGGAEREKER